MTTGTEQTLAQLADAIIENLDAKYDLVYVGYRDEPSDEQAAAIVSGDMDAFWESTQEWESDQRWESCKQIIEDETRTVLRSWEAATDVDFTYLAEALPGTDEYDRIRFEIEERDSGDWVRELIGGHRVLLRISVIDEDHGYSFEEVKARRVLKDVGLKATKENVKAVDYALANASPEYSVLMGFWIVSADLADIYDLPNEPDAEVEITDPYLYLGNPFVGSGFITEESLSGTVRVKRGDLKTDKDAFGYAVDEVYGGLNPSSFEASIKPVVTA